jgi:hypothetical protein
LLQWRHLALGLLVVLALLAGYVGDDPSTVFWGW